MKQSALLSAEMADKQKVQKATKQGTLITSNLHISPDEDDSPHTALDSYTDKPLATTNSNEYDASCITDNISYSDVSSYTPDEDDSPHTALDSYTDKPLATTNSNEYDASCTTDNISHSNVSSYTNTIIQQNCIEVSYAYINCRHCSYFL